MLVGRQKTELSANRVLRNRRVSALLAFAVLAVVASTWLAASTDASGPSSNRMLNYQIRLTDTSGIPVADGTKNLKITIYDASSGGNQLYTNCATTDSPTGVPESFPVIFTNGTGSILIGDTGITCNSSGFEQAIPATLFNNTALWLGVTVEADAEMTPRKRIVATGYALNADKLDDLETSAIGGASAFVPVTDSSGNLTLTQNVTVDTNTFFVDSANNSVGVGDSDPSEAKLSIAAGTATTDVNALSITQTWNNAAVAFTAVDIQVTPTANASSSNLFRVRSASSSLFYVNRSSGGNHTVVMTDGGANTFSVGSGLNLNTDNASLVNIHTGAAKGLSGTKIASGYLSIRKDAAANTVGYVEIAQGVVNAATAPSALYLLGGAHTALTASTEHNQIYLNLAATVQFATGALATQRAVRIAAPTYGFVGASTITDAATLAISGAPIAGTNATITNSMALWVQAGRARFDGELVLGSISADPTGTNGMTYYNTTDNKFRCYQASAWTDCIGGVGSGANTALSNLASVAINADLVADSNNDTALGSATLRWSDLFLGSDALHLGVSASAEGQITYTDSTQDIFNFGTDATGAADMAFFTDDLYLDKSTSFVGIGDTSPDFKLDIDGTSSTLFGMTRTSAGQWMAMADGTDTFGLYNRAGTPEANIAANIGSLALDTTNGAVYVKTTDTANTGWTQLAAGSGANTALSNLASVAINADLVADSNNDTALGSATLRWSDLFLGSDALHLGVSASAEGQITYTDSTQDIFNFGTDATGAADMAFFTDDLYLDKSTSFVGIGDTSPDDLLNIHSAAAAAGLAITSLGTNTDSYLKFELTDGTANFTMGVDDSDSDKFKISTTALGTSDLFIIDASGNIGIANATPGSLLHIGSVTVNAAAMMIFGNTETTSQIFEPRVHQVSNSTSGTSQDLAIGAASTDGAVMFYTGALGAQYDLLGSSGSNLERLRIASTGSVTIGSAGAVPQVAITSSNASGNTTSSSLALNANSLTSGTGLYAASSSLSSGKLVNLQVSGTAAASDTQTVLNILTAGANATSSQTTYGAQIANTHTGTTSTNIGLYVGASGGITNYGLIVDGGNVGLGNTAPQARLHLGSSTVSTSNMILFGKTETTSGSFEPRIHQVSNSVEGTSQDLALGATTASGTILFYTGALGSQYDLLGSSGSNTERFRIDGAGDVSFDNDAAYFDESEGMFTVGSTESGSPGPRIQAVLSDSSTTLTTGMRTIFALRNEDTTNGNGSLISFQTKDTVGAIGGVVRIGSVNTSHATGVLSGDFVVVTRNSGTWAERFRILSTGNVGIGTAAPASKLDVEGGVAIGATYSGTTAAPTNGAIIQGDVGIGTSGPSYPLDVAGAIRTGTPGTDGQLRIYSEQGATDYEVIFDPHATMTQNVTYTLPANDGDASQILTTNGSGALSWSSAGGVNTALSNLASVAINASLIADSNNDTALGSATLRWSDLFLGSDALHLGVSASAEGQITYTDSTQDIFNFGTDATGDADIAFFTDDLYLDKSTGRVGIGTNAPTQQLALAATASSILLISGDTDNVTETDVAQVRLTQDGGVSTAYWGMDADSVNSMVFAVNSTTSPDIRFETAATGTSFGGTTRMSILNSGNVGIGDATPAALLTVGDGDDFQVGSTGNVSTSGTIQTGRAGTDGQFRLYSEQGATDYEVVFNPHATMTQTTTYTLPANDGDASQVLTTDGSGALSWSAAGGSGANTALSNLASVAINTSLIPDANNTMNLGSNTIRWRDLNLGISLHLGTSTTDESVFSYDTFTDVLNIGTDSTTNGDVAFFTDDLYLDKSSGFVGIGDTTPGDLLNIHSAAAAAGIAITSLGTDTDPYLKFELADGTGIFTMGVDDSDSDTFKISTTALGTNDRFVIDSSGNVGIATTPNSAARLHVVKTQTTATANEEYGMFLNHTDTGIVTSGIDNTRGIAINLDRSGATGGTITNTGLLVTMTDDGGGTSENMGLYVNVSGADTNYAATFFGGNVGIGTATPASLLTVGSGDKFQVDTNGNLTFNTTATTVDFASATNGNTFNWKIPQLATTGTCASAAAEGVIIRNTGGTQVGHVCIDGPSSGTPNKLRLYAEAFNATSTDVAEMYSTRPEDGIEAGDVVELDPVGDLYVRKSTASGSPALVGVISTSPGLALTGISESTGESEAKNGMMVALKGRVPVKVTLENGVIVPGDWLTASSTSGVAMKATGSGMVIGRALDVYDGSGEAKVRVFVEVGYWDGRTLSDVSAASDLADLFELTDDNTVNFSGRGIVNARFIRNLESIEGMNGIWSIDAQGKLVAKEIIADKIRAKEFAVEADDDTQTIGEGTVGVGNSGITINNPSIRVSDKIFVTFYGNTEGAWWISRRADGSFDVSLSKIASTDLKFEYWAIRVLDKRTPPRTEVPIEPPPTEPPAVDEDQPPSEELPLEENLPPPSEEPPAPELTPEPAP